MDKEHTATPTIDLSSFRQPSRSGSAASSPAVRVASFDRTGSDLSAFLGELESEIGELGTMVPEQGLTRMDSNLSAFSLRCSHWRCP
jgi:hypothetical protein